MITRLLAAMTAVAALSACGVDSTPQSSGAAPAPQSGATSGATSPSASAPAAPAADQEARKDEARSEKPADGEKKAE